MNYKTMHENMPLTQNCRKWLKKLIMFQSETDYVVCDIVSNQAFKIH